MHQEDTNMNKNKQNSSREAKRSTRSESARTKEDLDVSRRLEELISLHGPVEDFLSAELTQDNATGIDLISPSYHPTPEARSSSNEPSSNTRDSEDADRNDMELRQLHHPTTHGLTTTHTRNRPPPKHN